MNRKLPMLTQDNEAFWLGGSEGRLKIHWCENCSRYFHPPAPVCPTCRSLSVGARPVSGRGKILTFTINHQRWVPELDCPYVVAIVELEEQVGLRFLTNIVGAQPADISIGADVSVLFEQHDDIWIPMFERAS